MLRFLVFLFCLSASLSAQRTISGIVVDAKDGAPLSFVSVFLKSNQSYGVLTNERGEYTINLQASHLNDQLTFSLLSYETTFQPLTELTDEQTTLNLQLKSVYLELAEITIVSESGMRQLIDKVIARIPENYGAKKYMLRGYVHTQCIDEGAKEQVIEAMISIRDRPYDYPPRRHKTWIDEFRHSVSPAGPPKLLNAHNDRQYRLLGGYDFPWSNPARNHTVNWSGLHTSKLDEMTFINRGEYVAGADTLVKIQYGLKPKHRSSTDTTGVVRSNHIISEILINKTDLAILRNTQSRIDGKSCHEVVYQKIGDKYYLKKTSFDYLFTSSSPFTYQHTQLYITEVITDKKKLRRVNTGMPLDREVDARIDSITVGPNPAFKAGNELVKLPPTTEELKVRMKRSIGLWEQFRRKTRGPKK